MTHAYTPGLVVRSRTRIARERTLPLAGEVLVRAGERVRAEQVIARAQLPGDVVSVNVANQLGVAPEELERHLRKRVGDPVEKDEPLAETRPLIAWFKTVVAAPASGTIESASTVTGQVLIRGPAKPIELPAQFDATVADVSPGLGVRLICTAALAQGIFGVGRETFGTLHVVTKRPGEPLVPEMLDASHRGGIVAGGGSLPRETVDRASELGVRGLVCAGIEAHDLAAWLGYDLGVAITGDEDLPVTIVCTEGFGDIAMARRTFDLLCACRGRRASLSARTQIRAGVLRPELVVPFEEEVDEASADAGADTGLRAGDAVRLIREPHFGRIGTVSALPAEPREIETEARVRVMDVTLESGETVTVPRANVERIGP